MPSIGDVFLGREIGQATQLTTSFIWHACVDCGRERWIRYVVKDKRPLGARCQSCAHKLIFKERREGKRPLIIYTPEIRKHLRESKLGAKNPNFGKRGNKVSSWRGGRRHIDGYIRVWVHPDDFFYAMADKADSVAEHRLVMAKQLRRCLFPWEIVHHKNGVRDDNRLENLELITDRRYHMVDTNIKGYIKRLEKRIEKLEAEITDSKEHGIREV